MGKRTEPVYVTGHRNPDTDSIVSAMAYAALRNALGDREYVAARLGEINDETQMVLDRFDFKPPMRIFNLRTQVSDLNYDTPPMIGSTVTVNHAWNTMQGDTKISSIPVTNEDGTLYGMLTRGDIAAYDMDSVAHPFVEKIPLYNLLGALEGRIICGDVGSTDEVTGEMVIALPLYEKEKMTFSPGAIVLTGAQPDAIQQAITNQASLVIVCRAEVEACFREACGSVPIVSTPYDAYRAARMIYQAAPVSRICSREGIVGFHLQDYVDDVRESMLQSRFRSYPVLDASGAVVGTVSRFHLIRPKRKRVVLVDHNERAQSVPGLEQAEIMEIIDHHRLADVETLGPIYFRNEPVGSTTTIVATMYQEKGLMPSPNLAGLMVAAILSDTVMFKSPTCTQRDILVVERLARLAKISVEQLGHDIFTAASSEDKLAKDMVATDFKEFHIAGHNIGISQITCMDSERVLHRQEEFFQILRANAETHKYDMNFLMVTDVLEEGTHLLFVGDQKTVEQAFNVTAQGNIAFLPGIVSRKKQVVPMLSVLWG